MDLFRDFKEHLSRLIGPNSAHEFFGQMGSWFSSLFGGHLTGAEREANAFTSQEAQKERDWQEQMRASNYQTQVADMQQAGINPAVLYGNGASSSTPSGASASSVAPNAPSSLSELIQMFMAKAQLAKTEAETKNIEADTEVKNKTAEKTEQETALITLQKDYYPKLTDAQIAEINSHIRLQGAQAGEAAANAAFANAKAVYTALESEWYPKLQQAEIKLRESRATEADMRALEAQYSAYIEAYKNEYMNKYHTTVPDGAWVALWSHLADTFASTIFSKEGWMAIIQALQKAGAPVININQPPASMPPINVTVPITNNPPQSVYPYHGN